MLDDLKKYIFIGYALKKWEKYMLDDFKNKKLEELNKCG